MSTEVRSDGIVGDDVRLTIKASVNGTLSPEREEVFNYLLTRYSLRMLYDEEFKDVSKS
ncbi:hypothetical protein [Candidatus Liberibacter solanacearum]|nr:hypothetical protein [Candidatus Liberibacter solanacearum]